ncbi:MAG: hypothetical protein ACAH83_17850 [Alphaproteobacteria bacterium]
MAYRPRQPQPPKKRPLLSKWTILLVILGVGFAIFWHDPKLTQWAVGKAKPFYVAFSRGQSTPPETAPAATPVSYPAPAPSPVMPAAALPKDECAPWGHDAIAYNACQDHRQKIQATIDAKKARDKTFTKPTEEETSTTDASAGNK